MRLSLCPIAHWAAYAFPTTIVLATRYVLSVSINESNCALHLQQFCQLLHSWARIRLATWYVIQRPRRLDTWRRDWCKFWSACWWERSLYLATVEHREYAYKESTVQYSSLYRKFWTCPLVFWFKDILKSNWVFWFEWKYVMVRDFLYLYFSGTMRFTKTKQTLYNLPIQYSSQSLTVQWAFDCVV